MIDNRLWRIRRISVLPLTETPPHWASCNKINDLLFQRISLAALSQACTKADSTKHNAWVYTSLWEFISLHSSFWPYSVLNPQTQCRKKAQGQRSIQIKVSIFQVSEITNNFLHRDDWKQQSSVCSSKSSAHCPGKQHLTLVTDVPLNNFGKMRSKQPMSLCHIRDRLSRCHAAGKLVPQEYLLIQLWGGSLHAWE